MLQCKNCGAFLTNENGTKCFVCNYDNKIVESAQNSANENASSNNIQSARKINVAESDLITNSAPAESTKKTYTAQKNNSQNYAPQNENHMHSGPNHISAQRPQKVYNAAKNTDSKFTKNSADTRTRAFTRVRVGQLPPVSKTIIVLTCILCVVLVLLAGASIASNLLYSSYSEGAFYTQLETALIASDVGTLKGMVVGSGIEVTDAGLAALSKQFQTKQMVEELVASFNIATSSGEINSDIYSSLSLLKEEVFLGYNEYKLQVKPVDLNVPVMSENAVLTMDNIPVMGTYTNEIMAYTGIFPGIYTAVVTDQTLVGQSIQGEATDIALFDSNVAYVFEGALPISDITIAGCAQDNAVIYVNDVQVNEVPVGGTVTLPSVLVGSNIKIVITTQSGAVASSVVQYSEKDVTQLSFTQYEFSGGLPTQEQADAAVSAFFTSYLAAVNARDPALLINCTEELRTNLTAELSGDPLPVQFQFVSTVTDAARAQQSFNANNVHTVSVNVATEYTSTPIVQSGPTEDGETDETPNDDTTVPATPTETLTPHLTMELVFSQDGAWLVNSIRENSVENHIAGVIAPFA